MIEEKLYKLQKYMVTSDELFSEKENKVRLKLKPEDDLILIDNKNSLFWLFYITKYGYDHFIGLERKKFIEQEKEKYKNVDLFNQQSSHFKTHKLKKINIINNLLYEETNMATLKALCVYNNISVIVEYKYCYIELLFNSTPPYIYKNIDGLVCLKPYSTILINEIRKHKISIKDVEKKLNSVSYYKVDDLKNMANKLSISLFNENDKKKKKKIELYNEIKFKLNKL
uniref:Uncharacterized protein n=1 Tax=Megaviridae environmental sample TaxID=1737588 RepID=A0A5J6VLM6_9VIRU|nr:MAG: hypothetical protein [Megaviridae environmental sample]